MAIDLKSGDMLAGRVDDSPVGSQVPSSVDSSALGLAISPTITASFTISPNSCSFPIDATAGSVTSTLPTAASCFANGVGRMFIITKIDASANAATLAAAGAETISGSATYAMTTRWASVTVQSTGTGWLIIGKA